MTPRKRRVPTPVGQGRAAMSLGARDARHHRNPQAAQASAQLYGDGIGVDNRGRIRVAPAKPVEYLAPGTDPETVIAAFNDLLRQLKEAKLMEGG